MGKITFECETITPMFLAGADGKTPELRPPSIKAAMRFWWRALNGDLSIKELREKEAKIFGGSSEVENKSKFRLRIEKANITISNSKNIFPNNLCKNPNWYRKNISANVYEYLGYGVYDHRNGWASYIAPNSTFNITLSFHKDLGNDIKEIIIKSLKYVSEFSGLGAKNRNGFGQFKIVNMTEMNKNFKIKNNSNNSYSYFSEYSKLFKINNAFSSWQEALYKIGNIYRLAKLETDGAKYNYDNRVLLSSPIIQAKNKNVFNRLAKSYFISINKKAATEFEAKILGLPYFNIINDNSIFSSVKYHISLPKNIKVATDKFNEQLLKSNDIVEVKL